MSFDTSQRSKWIAMIATTAKRSLVARINERVREKKCLLCDSTATGPRGLCNAHYLQFYRKRNTLPKSKRPEFESEQIEEGRILAADQIREIKHPCPFTSSVG
jgi:hypothetical protein